MADSGQTDWNEAAVKFGVALAIGGGLLGYISNGGGGALLGAVAGFGLGAAIVRVFQGLGYVIVGGLILLSAYGSITTGWKRLGAATEPQVNAGTSTIPAGIPSSTNVVPPLNTGGVQVTGGSPSGGAITSEQIAPIPKKTPVVAGSPIRVDSWCDHDIRVFVKWLDANGRWRVEGPWPVAAGEQQILALADTGQIHATSREIYFAAEAPGTDLRWDGPNLEPFKGGTLQMFRATVWGFSSYNFRVGCRGDNTWS